MPEKKPNGSRETLVEQHAYDRLDHVEHERRKVYKKRPSPFKFSNVIMVIVLIIVLVMMIYPMFR
jgi:uncharacterized membrane protein YukC